MCKNTTLFFLFSTDILTILFIILIFNFFFFKVCVYVCARVCEREGEFSAWLAILENKLHYSQNRYSKRELPLPYQCALSLTSMHYFCRWDDGSVHSVFGLCVQTANKISSCGGDFYDMVICPWGITLWLPEVIEQPFHGNYFPLTTDWGWSWTSILEIKGYF